MSGAVGHTRARLGSACQSDSHPWQAVALLVQQPPANRENLPQANEEAVDLIGSEVGYELADWLRSRSIEAME